jgi:hypothetical protein
MATPESPDRSRSVTLSLSREAEWTLHHVLLDRLERDATLGGTARVDLPPVELFRAFETVDRGDTRFTVAQLEAIQTVLVEYHHATTWWELERARIEQLLHCVSGHLDHQPVSSTD